MSVSIPPDLRLDAPQRAAPPIEAPPKKGPTVDMVGTYTLAEPKQLQDPKSKAVYDVKPGEYPVMGRMSSDGKKVEAAGIIFTGTRGGDDERVSIAEKLRPIDVPALVQRQQLRLEQRADRSVKFPLSMFLGEAPAANQSQAQSQGRTQSKDHSQGHNLSR